MNKKSEEMKKKMTEMGYDKMTDAQKKAFKTRMAMMKKGLMDRADDNEKMDMNAKAKFGYFKMDSKKKALFDAYQKKVKGDRDSSDGMLMKKIIAFKESAEFKALPDEKKKAVLEEKMAAFKKMYAMKDSWRKDDDEQRKKANYFGMKDGQRKVYDEKEAAFAKKRGMMEKAWMADEESTMKKLGFMNMSADKKKYFMDMWDKKKKGMMDQKMRERRDDDDKRMKTNYYDRSESNRKEYDEGLQRSRGMNYGMDGAQSGKAGSYCGKMQRKMPGYGGRDGPGGKGPGGPGGKGRMLQAKMGGPGGPGGYGKCDEGLCCGMVSQGGLYEASYTICGSRYAVSYKGMAFKCLNAQNLMAGTAALLSAAYMMM